jgi:hypothetical protein
MSTYDVGMSAHTKVQYTLRAVPRAVDRRLRQLAKESGRSLNQIAVEALARGAGIPPEGEEPLPRRDVSYLVGSWKPEPEVLEAFAAFRRVDAKLWR